jgi:hypothetical protein
MNNLSCVTSSIAVICYFFLRESAYKEFRSTLVPLCSISPLAIDILSKFEEQNDIHNFLREGIGVKLTRIIVILNQIIAYLLVEI